MTEPHRDPVDTLLREAFAADRARTPAPQTTARVMAVIRRRQLRRRLVLGAGGAGGLALALMSARPALDALMATFAGPLSSAWNDSALALGALAVVVGVWLLILEEEAG